MTRILSTGALILVAALAFSIPVTATPSIIHNGIDLWSTPADGRSFINFKFEPIPAGFFCAGAEPYHGKIVWKGSPIAAGEGYELGRKDTIVQRLDDAVFDNRGRATTRIQVRALSLEGVTPVKTSCGLFNVKALLDGAQPITRMRIFLEDEKGGFFIAPLALNVKLLFTPAGKPGARPLVLKQSIRFNQNPSQPWAVDRPAGQTGYEDFVKVDTDGDAIPDTTLPGTSNFLAGPRGREKLTTNSWCHRYVDEPGSEKWHCPEN